MYWYYIALVKDNSSIAINYFNKRAIKLWCVTEAAAYNELYGRGGVMVVHNTTGISRPTIYAINNG